MFAFDDVEVWNVKTMTANMDFVIDDDFRISINSFLANV